jgi:hypothetical protein
MQWGKYFVNKFLFCVAPPFPQQEQTVHVNNFGATLSKPMSLCLAFLLLH